MNLEASIHADADWYRRGKTEPCSLPGARVKARVGARVKKRSICVKNLGNAAAPNG
jgi:hypothetical protein